MMGRKEKLYGLNKSKKIKVSDIESIFNELCTKKMAKKNYI